MRRFVFFCLTLALALLKASAVSYSFDEESGTLTLDFSQNTGTSLDGISGNINNGSPNIKDRIVILKIVGSVSTDQIQTIYNNNWIDQNKNNQTLDLYDATITGGDITDKGFRGGFLILPKNSSLPDESNYVPQPSNLNGNKKLRYVCSLNDDGTLYVGGGNFENRNGENAIANAINNNVFPFNQATHIVLSGDYTDADETAVNTFNASNAKTTFKDGVLTLAPADDTAEGLKAAVESEELANGAEYVNKVVFSDGSIWERTENGGKLTTAQTPDTHESALTNAGLPVTETIVERTIGKYVKVVGDETIVTITASGQLDNLTQAEKDALKNCEKLKLVGGPYNNDPDYFRLAAYTGVAEGEPAHEFELDLSDAIIDKNNRLPTAWQNSVTSITLPNDPDFKTIPELFCYQFSKLISVVIPSQIETIGKQAFKECTAMAYVDFSEANSLKTIGEEAFFASGISTGVEFPPSLETIETWAFGHCTKMRSITIPKGSQMWKEGCGIKANAFEMNTSDNELKNVYILEDEHELLCDAKAFGYDNTDGQTKNMATVKTRLHYPPNLYYYYVGEWKSQINDGVVAGHQDLLNIRNVVEKGSETVEGQTVTAIPRAGIGWQKFISSGIPVVTEMDWRTYSDVVNLRVPQKVDKVAKVYIVYDYRADGTACLKQMKPNDIIPAGTGIILHHYVTDTSESHGGLIHFEHVKTEEEADLISQNPDVFKPYLTILDGETDKRAKPVAEGGEGRTTRKYSCDGTDYNNYLEGIHTQGAYRFVYNAENGKYKDGAIENQTYEMERGGSAIYRNFFFAKGKLIQQWKDDNRDWTGDDWVDGEHGNKGWGFFRSVSGKYDVNSKAFLHLPATMFTSKEGIYMNADEANAAAQNNSAVQSGSKGMMLYIFDEDIIEENGVATNIHNFATQENDDCYYTLQGLKVKQPVSNGIYIHNGKKIVVK